VVVGTATFVVLIAAWVLVTRLGLIDPLFFPSPGAVIERFVRQLANGELVGDTVVSVYRILVGYSLATVMAIPLGILMGSYRLWEAATEPLIDFIRYMPVVAFVPLSIVWVGTDDSQKFLIIWMGTFFQQVLLVMDASKRVPKDLVDLGRTLGLKDSKILRRIILPSAAPGIWDALRISLGWAWTWLVLAELVAATSGLGYRITLAQRYFNTDTIIAYVIVLGILGLITDQVFRALGRKFFRYEEMQR
jgi:NitT/TauT family transport system permease protein